MPKNSKNEISIVNQSGLEIPGDNNLRKATVAKNLENTFKI